MPQSRRKSPLTDIAGPLVAAGRRLKGSARAALAKLAGTTDLKSVVLEDVWVRVPHRTGYRCTDPCCKRSGANLRVPAARRRDLSNSNSRSGGDSQPS